MSMQLVGKWATTLFLALTLTGCIDATVEVEVLSDTTARGTLTQVMGADFYAMMKMNAEDSDTSSDQFCAEGELTEAADGSATCVLIEEGTFDELAGLAEGENAMRFTPAGPGLIRVALPTAEMMGEIGAGDDMDAETKQMIEAFFAGHTVTIRIGGSEVTDTNMTLADDGKSAETVLPFLDLINGTAELPDELYAIVRAP